NANQLQFWPVSPLTPQRTKGATMFDATARVELEEALGYERYVLQACNDAIRMSRGVCGPTKLVIPDEGPNQVWLHITDCIGDTGAEMTSRITPLIFSAAYKLLDMVVEWIIRENGLACPFPFTKKVEILDNTPHLTYPAFLQTDLPLR